MKTSAEKAARDHGRPVTRVGNAILAVLVAIMWLSHHLLGAGALAQSPPVPTYRLIVHPSNPATSIDRAFMANLFLKKIRKWPDGETAEPVDLAHVSPVRRAFSDSVLQRSVEAVRNYWQQVIFSGRDLPPPELSSEDAVVTYVLRRPGAVGYVSARTDLRGAKVLDAR